MKVIYELKNKRKTVLDEAEAAINAKNLQTYQEKMNEVDALNQEIEARELLNAEEGRFRDSDKKMVEMHQAQQEKKTDLAMQAKIDAARSGNEYVNAFAHALQNGVTVKKGVADESLRPLYNAMTIGGGSPVGADGGFLVPVEFDNMIHLKMKEFIRLADYFNVENVSGYTGWRAIETTASRTTLPLIGENKPITPNAQPSFQRVDYTVKKYGDRLPVSSELMEDNTAGLMQYLANWFAPRVVMTENALLISLLDGLTAKNFTDGKLLSELKTLLNSGLNTAISRNSILLCNQSSYDYLDQLEDKNGRGLLTPNPADPDVYRFKNRPVVFADDDLIPNRKITTSGATKGDYYPIYVGCFKAFGTLFRRKAMEFATTDIGGDAWENDTTEVRGIVRMDAQKVDENAAAKREIFIAATT